VLVTLCLTVGLVSFGVHAGGLLMLEKGDRETQAALDGEVRRLAVLEREVEETLGPRLDRIARHAGGILWAPFLDALARCLPPGDRLEEVRFRPADGSVSLRAAGEGAERFRGALLADAAVRRWFPHVEEVPAGAGREYGIRLSREEMP
jgi:hypothetical protein